MSIAESRFRVTATNPRPKRWTPEEFDRLHALGFFNGELVELIHGEFVRVDPGPRQKRLWEWTRKSYYQLWEMGFIPEKRVQLVDGEIFLMLPQNPPQASIVKVVEKALEKLFGNGYTARPQLPLDLGTHSEPEPDIAMVIGDPRDFLRHHPKGAVLVVEVSDSTLTFDRKTKGLAYARGGITDYWIVNLIDGCLEVYRQPTKKGYTSSVVLEPGDVVSPLALPKAKLKVADLLP